MPSRIRIGPDGGPYVIVEEDNGDLDITTPNNTIDLQNSGLINAALSGVLDAQNNDISNIGALSADSVNTDQLNNTVVISAGDDPNTVLSNAPARPHLVIETDQRGVEINSTFTVSRGASIEFRSPLIPTGDFTPVEINANINLVAGNDNPGAVWDADGLTTAGTPGAVIKDRVRTTGTFGANGFGGNGIVVRQDGTANLNGFDLNCRSVNNGGDGLLIENVSGNVDDINYPLITVREARNNGGDGVHIADGFAGQLRFGQVTANGDWGINLEAEVASTIGGGTEGNTSGGIRNTVTGQGMIVTDSAETPGIDDQAEPNSQSLLYDVDKGRLRFPAIDQPNSLNSPTPGITQYRYDHENIHYGNNSSVWRAAGAESGTYTGDGTTSRTISLGFRPNVVIVFDSGGTPYDAFDFPIGNRTGVLTNQPTGGLTITDDGFVVDDNAADADPNTNGESYNWMAW